MAICPSFKPVLDLLCITYPQDLVLHFLWEQDGRTIGQIAERLSLESSTVTPLVKRLEAGGFLTRARSAADERRVDVRLTERGAAMRGRAEARRVGKEGVRTCRSRVWGEHSQTKRTTTKRHTHIQQT